MRYALQGVLLAVLLFAAVVPPLSLPAAFEWFRWIAYLANVVMIFYVGRQAWAMRRTIGNFQSSLDVASKHETPYAEAVAAQRTVDALGDFTTFKALGTAVFVALGCVLMIAVLTSSLFFGLAARSDWYHPDGLDIAHHDYWTFLAYVMDCTSLRGFFGFLDLFETPDIAGLLGWTHAFPRQIKLTKAPVIGLSLAALRMYSQIVAAGMLFTIAKILNLRRQYDYLFIAEKRRSVIGS